MCCAVMGTGVGRGSPYFLSLSLSLCLPPPPKKKEEEKTRRGKKTRTKNPATVRDALTSRDPPVSAQGLQPRDSDNLKTWLVRKRGPRLCMGPRVLPLLPPTLNKGYFSGEGCLLYDRASGSGHAYPRKTCIPYAAHFEPWDIRRPVGGGGRRGVGGEDSPAGELLYDPWVVALLHEAGTSWCIIIVFAREKLDASLGVTTRAPKRREQRKKRNDLSTRPQAHMISLSISISPWGVGWGTAMTRAFGLIPTYLRYLPYLIAWYFVSPRSQPTRI